jgi:hypothetical protein
MIQRAATRLGRACGGGGGNKAGASMFLYQGYARGVSGWGSTLLPKLIINLVAVYVVNITTLHLCNKVRAALIKTSAVPYRTHEGTAYVL